MRNMGLGDNSVRFLPFRKAVRLYSDLEYGLNPQSEWAASVKFALRYFF